VALHQRGKGRFTGGAGVFLKQGGVFHRQHSSINARRKQNGTGKFNFSPVPGRPTEDRTVLIQKRRKAAALQDAGATATAPACAKRLRVRQSSGAFPPAPGTPASQTRAIAVGSFQFLASDFSCKPMRARSRNSAIQIAVTL
jgi:hypothetical protein